MFKNISIAAISLAMIGCGGGNDDTPEAPVTPQTENTKNCETVSLGFVNFGAEDVDATTSEDQFGVLDSWEIIEGNTASTLYGMGGYPDVVEGQGTRLFTGGNEETSIAQQTSTLSAAAAGCSFILSADIGGFASQEDNALVELSFLASSGDILTTTTLGPVTSEDRQAETSLIRLERNGTIPETAVQAIIKITQNRLSGSANDGYVDNVEVTFNDE